MWKNAELLDSVRYIIQCESESEAVNRTHTVLLLNVARGDAFTGYQGKHITPARITECPGTLSHYNLSNLLYFDVGL